ncbi:MAG TPA: hypothetical protein PLY40_07510 [Bacillota bacterium]|nr:hypothetical protein [Bacillota bacterium]
MITVGMMDGEVKKVDQQIDTELNYLHTPVGGIHTPLQKPMQIVKPGDILAAITDVFGNHLAEIECPFDAVVVGYYSVPVIQPGDWSYLIGRLL